jgi:hypothetical protein
MVASAATPEDEAVWALEDAYFAHLYAARHEQFRALLHPAFHGWPGAAPHPVDAEGSARFAAMLAPEPIACSIAIEREGLTRTGAVAVTHFAIRVTLAATGRVRRSRITHTWVREDDGWLLLGGMSDDDPETEA